MGTDKRARQKANREARLQAEKAEAKAETREATTRRIGVWVGVAAAIIGLFVLIGFLRGGDDDGSDSIALTPTPVPESAEAEAEAVPEVQLASDVPDDFVPWAGTGALAGVEPSARNGAYHEAPPMTIDPARSYAAVVNTSAGTIRLELFADEAPLAVNNFVNLARDGFYDGVTFHRVIEDFMAQGGDPTGSGSGGPGYSFADEFTAARVFDSPGQLAMANSGPATNGSQFFITFVPTPHLDGLHTIFGQLTGDEAVLNDIVRTGEGDATVIDSVSIIEG